MHAGRISMSPGNGDYVRDSLTVALAKVGGKHAGALQVLGESCSFSAQIDPANRFGGLGFVVLCDQAGVYAEDIWTLWHDVCRSSYLRAHTVLRAVQLGLLNESLLRTWLDFPEKLPDTAVLDSLITQVRGILPAFAAEDTHAQS